MTKGYKGYKGKLRYNGNRKGKGKGKGKGKYLLLKEKSKKKRDYVFTTITLRTFLKNNDISSRVSIESSEKIEEITKNFVLELVRNAEIYMHNRNSKTLSANDIINSNSKN